MAWRFTTRIGTMRTNRFARIDLCKEPYFHNVKAIRANRLKAAIRNFQPSEARFAKKGFSSGTLNDSRKPGDSRETANRFAQIGPSKYQGCRIVSLDNCGNVTSSIACRSCTAESSDEFSPPVGRIRMLQLRITLSLMATKTT